MARRRTFPLDKLEVLDDGAVRRSGDGPQGPRTVADYEGGRARVGTPIVETVSTDTGRIPRQPIHPDVLSGRNPHRFVQDGLGRTVLAEGQVLALDNVRNPGAQRDLSGPYRDAGGEIDATHLIARTLGGPGGAENLVAASESINREEIRDFEKKLEAMSAADPKRELFLQVNATYDGDHDMPTMLTFAVFERTAGGDPQPVPGLEQDFYPSH